MILMNCVFIAKLCIYCVYWWIVCLLTNCVFIWMNLSIFKQEITGYGSWYWWIVCLLNCVMNFWNKCDSVFIDELCVYMMNCVFIWMNLSISKQGTIGYGSWYWWIVCLLMNCVLCYINELCVYMMNCVFIWMNLSISK